MLNFEPNRKFRKIILEFEQTLTGNHLGSKIAFSLYFADQYPFKPPLVFALESDMLSHSFIDRQTGLVQLSILDSDWKPTLELANIV